jgi:two-component system, OmpR family, sensor histidine kinase TctE
MIGHEALLAALIHNLTENALRYTPPGGHVTVRVARDAAHVLLTVTDDGPGIPAEARSRVFEPFYRASAETEGTGLGLAIAKEIVLAHRGEIELRTPERGLVVAVCFDAESQGKS